MVCRNNANAALIFEFLYRFISISRSYFGKLDEESVKNNFVLIYELIDGWSYLKLENWANMDQKFSTSGTHRRARLILSKPTLRQKLPARK